MVYLSVKEAAILETITDRAMRKRITHNKVISREIRTNKGRGGVTYEVALSSLSPKAQENYWQQQRTEPAQESLPYSTTALQQDDTLQQELYLEQQVQRALNCPDGIRTTDWVSHIASELNMSPRTLYRKMENLKTYGTLSVPRKRRSDRGVVRSWDGGAEDIFRALAMKPENRHSSVQSLYNRTQIEAEKHGLSVGSLRTAYRIYEEMGSVAHTYRKKGWRGVENEVLPPVLRDYSDLQVNDIWVGDQHTFNWFVLNPYTGNMLRLQGYMWQDLRSRGITGFSLAAQYDAHTIGLALRNGIMPKDDRIIYGKPRCVYNDWGKPERSRYMTKLQATGIEVRDIDDDFEQFVSPFTTADTGVLDELSIDTRSAIVRNSKAKLIERTFGVLEQMLLDEGLKGFAGHKVGTLTDADKADLKRWHKNGELMTIEQFADVVYRVLAKYNARPHRGYGMRGLSPDQTFQNAVAKGYKPITLNKHQADLIFLKSAKRKVSSRGVNVDGNWFHDMEKMVDLVGKLVEIRWQPFGDEVLVFYQGDMICRAPAYRYGSMADPKLTEELLKTKHGIARNVKKELAAIGALKEKEVDERQREQVRQAVTRFDKSIEEAPKPKQKPKRRTKDVDLWKLIAETNRSAVFEHN